MYNKALDHEESVDVCVCWFIYLVYFTNWIRQKYKYPHNYFCKFTEVYRFTETLKGMG